MATEPLWTKTMAEYKDDETTAEIMLGQVEGGVVYRLAWNDGVANEWIEDFPYFDTARRRLAALILALTREGKGFTLDHVEFLSAELGHDEAFGWRTRGFQEVLEAAGYEPHVIDMGGGMLAVETASKDGRVITWADDGEGWARIGVYPAHTMAQGEGGALINWHDATYLETQHARQLIDLLGAIESVVGEVEDPHQHSWDDSVKSGKVYCTICGVRSPF